MKVLLDTNIVIHRESSGPINKEIGHLFWWIDNLGYAKYIHPVTVQDFQKLRNKATRDPITIKIENYNVLPTIAPTDPRVAQVAQKYDSTDNDVDDTALVNELYCARVDVLITEDRQIHQKARDLGIEDRVFTIDAFLEKLTAENPSLVDYRVPSVRKEFFGDIDARDEFFDSFKEDYVDFEAWFKKKAHEIAYICRSADSIVAFLYLKPENEKESYWDIKPTFAPKKRLKIGTFKVRLNGYKLGERLLKVVFDNALLLGVSEIYVTIFPKRVEQRRLVYLLEDFGFRLHGVKVSQSGEEQVYVRDFSPNVSLASPRTTFPFLSANADKFIVPIYPEYHTSLFPDSILKTESPNDYVEQEPHRNAISKVYVSRSIERGLKPSTIIVFYRTGGYYKSVVTTLGIVESVVTGIKNIQQFRSLCRQRSVFSDVELEQQWNYSTNSRPFIVNFLYAYSFPRRPNLKRLIELGVIANISSAPRGFEQLSDDSFTKIIAESGTDESIVVH